MARVASESPIDDDTFGALDDREGDAEAPDVPAEAAQYIRKLFTIANDTGVLRGAPFVVQPNVNAPCQWLANEVHRDVLPDGSHVTAMGAIKGEFGLNMSATMSIYNLGFLSKVGGKLFVCSKLVGFSKSGRYGQV